jgi:hypothetical protein
MQSEWKITRSSLEQEQSRRSLIKALDSDLPAFCELALRIRPKAGPLQPFILNAAQLKLHEIIEKQRAEKGRVRVIVLKARQLGVSTYVAARLYRHTINNMGTRCIILAHERRASSNLFEIVKRFHDGVPAEIKPSVGTSNAESLLFDRLDSGYIVTVATGEGTGRSATAQLLHASETAFWDDLQLQMAALMQTVPDVDGTEIIIESTANGYNDFHTLWRKAEAGESEFLPVFLPWSLDTGYSREVAPDFKIAQDESGLVDAYDLSNEQLAWRRAKIAQLGNAEYFAQEYPLNAAEAFISASFDSFNRWSFARVGKRWKSSMVRLLLALTLPVWGQIEPLLLGARVVALPRSNPVRASIRWRLLAGCRKSFATISQRE